MTTKSNMTFDKSGDLFPIKEKMTFLAHCSISPLYSPAAERSIELIREQQYKGFTSFGRYYFEELEQLKLYSAQLLHTRPENMAAVKNTSEALSMVANGYPFEPGDEVISYVHEYPANHYPWRLQERRGVKLKLLDNIPARPDIDTQLPGSWSMKQLERAITPKTKVIALSHVQFTSGFAADLAALGKLCKEHGIDLVIDAAQSLGSMPLDPEKYHIAALASAGWKWLMGPFGTGLFYTAPAFRDKLQFTQVGAEMMQQGMDFLDHSWNPHESAKRFEYSSSPVIVLAALRTSVQEIHARYGADALYEEIIRLQDIFLEHLDNPAFKTVVFKKPHRSGILSLYHDDLEGLTEVLKREKIACSARGGYLRIAPHFHNTEADMKQLAEVLNNL